MLKICDRHPPNCKDFNMAYIQDTILKRHNVCKYAVFMIADHVLSIVTSYGQQLAIHMHDINDIPGRICHALVRSAICTVITIPYPG